MQVGHAVALVGVGGHVEQQGIAVAGEVQVVGAVVGPAPRTSSAPYAPRRSWRCRRARSRRAARARPWSARRRCRGRPGRTSDSGGARHGRQGRQEVEVARERGARLARRQGSGLPGDERHAVAAVLAAPPLRSRNGPDEPSNQGPLSEVKTTTVSSSSPSAFSSGHQPADVEVDLLHHLAVGAGRRAGRGRPDWGPAAGAARSAPAPRRTAGRGCPR